MRPTRPPLQEEDALRQRTLHLRKRSRAGSKNAGPKAGVQGCNCCRRLFSGGWIRGILRGGFPRCRGDHRSARHDDGGDGVRPERNGRGSSRLASGARGPKSFRSRLTSSGARDGSKAGRQFRLKSPGREQPRAQECWLQPWPPTEVYFLSYIRESGAVRRKRGFFRAGGAINDE